MFRGNRVVRPRNIWVSLKTPLCGHLLPLSFRKWHFVIKALTRCRSFDTNSTILWLPTIFLFRANRLRNNYTGEKFLFVRLHCETAGSRVVRKFFLVNKTQNVLQRQRDEKSLTVKHRNGCFGCGVWLLKYFVNTMGYGTQCYIIVFGRATRCVCAVLLQHGL